MQPHQQHSSVELDNDAVEALLGTMRPTTGDRAESPTRTQLRYLRKLGFPATAQAGRGKRAMHDLDAVLRIVLVFELLAFGISASIAVSTVEEQWPTLRDALLGGWSAYSRSRSIEGGADLRDEAMDKMRNVLRLVPSSLPKCGWLKAEVTPASSFSAVYSGSIAGPSQILLDPYAIVGCIVAGLTGTLRYREAELQSSFSLLSSSQEVDEEGSQRA